MATALVVTTPPRKTGRPTKLTPELQEKICRYIAAGNYLSVSCQAVGIDDVTFNLWLRQGAEEQKNGGGMFYDFLMATKRAEALQEAEVAARVLAGSMPGVRKKVTKSGPEGEQVEVTETSGDWLAAATYLERRHPDRWGRKDRTRIDINETKEITITHVDYNLAQATPEQVIEADTKELIDDASKQS